MESTAGSDSPNYELEDAVPKPSSPKRNRRSVQKRVVTVPISDVEGSRSKSGGEGAPPSDSWAWRKYGQKPIKGSPYPRGYYRCSSSKGCPARKQVERSRVDPTTIVVTYACEHNHPWPVSKSRSQSSSKAPAEGEPADPVRFGPAAGLPEPEERYSDLMITPEDYRWFSDVASNSSGSPPPDLLVGAMAADVATFMEECDELAGGEEEEEDSLFAGLGELPECSLVLRRGATAARGEERQRCSLAASQ